MNTPEINKVIKDLSKADLKSLYGTTTIDPFIIVHYSLQYDSFIKILKKYSLDVKKFHEELMKYINLTVKEYQRVSPQGDSIDYGFNSNTFFSRKKEGNISLTHDYTEIYNRCLNLEIRNLNNNPPKPSNLQIVGGRSELEMKVNLLTFFESFLLLAQKNQFLSTIHDMLDKSGFKTHDFLTDCESGDLFKADELDKLCDNLNELAYDKKISKVIGREKELESLVLTLTKHKKNNPVLIGKAGVGKTAIAEGLAEMIVNGDVPKQLSRAVVYNLPVANLVSGTKFRGEFEERVTNLLKEFKKKEERGEMPILFIDEIHSIVGSGNSNGLDLSNILKPALARGEIRTIGATTTDEWHKFITDNKALKRRFIPITIKEPTYSQTFEILKQSRDSYEKKHNVEYEINSIIRSIELSNEFMDDLAQPDKSFDLIDIAGAYCAYNDKDIVEPEDVEFALHKTKGISLDAIQYSKKKNVVPIKDRLKLSVFGQESAIDTISKSVEINLAGIGDPTKPIGSFLFVGPTGVGKTELAKNLANEMNAHFERLDMSEYMDETSANKLLGSAPGFVGYESGSPLTKVLQENPRTVLLLDEIEKAHPKIYDLLLQAMDNAQVTDSKGNKISFKNVVLVMTSNAGASHLEKRAISLGEENTVQKSKSDSEIKNIFKPEFRGRLTKIVNFNPMNSKLLEKILMKELGFVNQRFLKRNIKLKLSDTLKKHIVNDSLSKNLGARPLKNILNEEISSLISNEILYGKLKDNKTVKIVTATINKENEFILDIK